MFQALNPLFITNRLSSNESNSKSLATLGSQRIRQRQAAILAIGETYQAHHVLQVQARHTPSHDKPLSDGVIAILIPKALLLFWRLDSFKLS